MNIHSGPDRILHPFPPGIFIHIASESLFTSLRNDYSHAPESALARFGAPISDERLPIEVLDLSRMMAVEGRVLIHGQGDQSGRNYLMLEGMDSKIHFVHYTPEMEQARSRGQLRVNSFVRLRNLSPDGAVILEIKDLGDAERLLSNGRYLINTASELLNQGIIPTEDGWGGWLGRYQKALAEAARHIGQLRRAAAPKNERNRDRDRSLGR